MKKKIALVFSIILLITLLFACSERQSVATVSFVTNGGSVINDRQGTIESFPKSSKQNYRIEGWYFDKNLKNKVSFPYTPTTDVILYAKWTSLTEGSEGLSYEKTADETAFIVSGYSEKSYSVVIPDTHLDKPVIGIKHGFLKNKNSIYLLCIGKNVEYIEEDFFRCNNLKDFEINGENQFFYVKNNALYDVVNDEIYAYPLGRNDTAVSIDCKINKNAFDNNTTIKRIVINGDAYIPDGSFSGMTALEEFVCDGAEYYTADNGILYSQNYQTLLKYPQGKKDKVLTVKNETVTVLDGALEGAKIESVYLGENLTNFDDYSVMPNLLNYEIAENNAKYQDIDGVIYSKNGDILYRFPTGKNGEYTVENGVEKIYSFAFSSAKINKLFLPKSLKTIGQYAFESSSLEEITFAHEGDIEEIGAGALSECSNLKKVTLLSRVPPNASEYLFDGVDSDFVLVIPANATEIYAYFWNFAYQYFDASGLALTEYSVTFNTLGGEEVDKIHGVFIADRPSATYDGKIFAGWYDNEDCYGFAIEFPYVIDGHVTFYADWRDVVPVE